MSCQDYKVVVDVVSIPKILQNEPFIVLRERNLIQTLKETI
jgi:hypothetical protein